MSKTLAGMRAQVQLVLGNRSDITSDMIDEWLNDSQLAIASGLRIYEVESAVTFLLAIAGPNIDIYSHPDNFWSPMLMVNVSDNRAKISLKPIETVLTTPPTPAGRPQIYGIRGRTFVFRPEPTTSDTLELTFKRRLPTMTASVNMALPDEFAPAVVFDAIVRGLHLTGDEDRAKIYRDHRDDAFRIIGDARGDEFTLRQDGVVIAGMDPAVRLA